MDPKKVAKRAFTLVELMVVIAVIMVLLSLLIVGLNVATRASQTASTTALMQAMVQGTVQFKEDVGYYPPVLGNRRELLALPPTDDRDRIQQWRSITSPAEYLLGYAGRRHDGYGIEPDEVPFTGIRHPGPNGVWGADVDGSIDTRDPPVPDALSGVSAGRVMGPYIEVDNDRLLASLDPIPDGNGNAVVHFPGENGYDEDAPKVICDYWGRPIQYFRRQYPLGAIGQSYRAGVDYNGDGDIDADDLPTLSDVIRLRPYEVAPGSEATTRFLDDNIISGLNNNLTSVALETAEFAFFSTGPDRQKSRREARNDDGVGELNKDNLVELGP